MAQKKRNTIQAPKAPELPKVPTTKFQVEDGQHAGIYQFTVARFFNPVTKEVIDSKDALKDVKTLELLVERQSGVIEFVSPLKEKDA